MRVCSVLCVCACVCACVRACVRTCVRPCVCVRVYSRRQVAELLVLVSLDHVQAVDVEHAVRVDRHQDAADVRLAHTHMVTYRHSDLLIEGL